MIWNIYGNATIDKIYKPFGLYATTKGSLKVERVFGSIYKSRQDARRNIFDYIEMFYNSKRRHSYLGYLSQKSLRKRCY